MASGGGNGGGDERAVYRVKSINFLGRRVPIMLQDVNGPCPLLAIANVLLLRNQLQLPAGVGEVSQDRLAAMVAEHLLDSNSLEGEGGGSGGTRRRLSEDQAASLAHNLSDAIALLPKLATGIDVNLRFHEIHGFEYTPETAVFDLLDIPLVHGWLVDPQDEPTARAVGTKSYNELVVQLVTALGSAATPKQLTPTASLRSQQLAGLAEGLSPRTSGPAGGLPAIAEHGVVPLPAAAAAPGSGQRRGSSPQLQIIDAAMLSAALQDTLRLSEQQEGGAPVEAEADSGPASARAAQLSPGAGQGLGEASRAASNISSLQTSDSMHSMVNRMLTDLVSDTFTTGTPQSARSLGAMQPSSARAPGSTAGGEEEAGGSVRGGLPPGGPASGSGSTADLAGAAGTAAGLAQAASGGSSGPMEWFAKLTLAVAEGEEGGDGAVRAELALCQRPPPSPFDLSPTPSGSVSRQELGAAGAAGPARRSTPPTPHPSAASFVLNPDSGSSAGLAPAAGSGAATPPAGQQAAAGGGGAPVGAAAAPASGGTSPGEAAVRDALLAQQFLEGNPSQLTVHGLVALQEGLRRNQLAVFFRNNHFNCMFKGPDDQLYLLATDEGFQFESDVVWEHLISVDGDTALVGGDFRPFQPHASQEDAAARQAAAQDAEWAAAAAAAGDTHDADLALAMQLQAEEEERVRVEQERRQQQLARQQEQERRAAAEQQQQQRVLPSQRRPGSGSSMGSGAGGQRKKEKKKSSNDACCVM